MAVLSDAQLLAKIKSGLGIATNFQDETIQIYIDEVKSFMSDSGVPAAVVSDSAAVGCILRGVSDLWNYGSGDVSLSEYFRQRVTQLAMSGESGGGGTSSGSYNDLTDIPTLNGTTIAGDLESDDVGIDVIENNDIINLF